MSSEKTVSLDEMKRRMKILFTTHHEALAVVHEKHRKEMDKLRMIDRKVFYEAMADLLKEEREVL